MNIFKYLPLIIILVSCKEQKSSSQLIKHSKIDSLNSITEVENFIRLKDTSLNNFHLKEARHFSSEQLEKFSKTNKSEPYYKGDFDGNGFRDLFVTGNFSENENFMYSFVFMNYGKDSINTIWLKDHQYVFIPRVTKHVNQDFLEIYSNDFLLGLRHDKLIFKYGGFINFNNKPGKYHIEKIEFTTYDIRGEFEVVVDRSLSVPIKNIQGYYDENIIKKSKIKLATKDHAEIFNMLNYMDFPKLKDSLHISGTDQPFCNLKITYDNGKVKKIFDYGMEENFSLKNLYTKLEAPRKFLK